jgi:RNA polymerase sigma factor (sigma-70 family)
MGDLAARAAVGAETAARIGTDPAALEMFYRAHYDDVVRYFARRVNDPHLVADLVAETFLTVVECAGRFDPRKGRPLAWLFGIAHHTLQRSHRRRDTDRRLAVRLAGRRELDDDDIAELEAYIDKQGFLTRLPQAVRRLSPGERELVGLVDVEGLTPSEAGRILRIPATLARVRLHRARTKLRTVLTSAEEEA